MWILSQSRYSKFWIFLTEASAMVGGHQFHSSTQQIYFPSMTKNFLGTTDSTMVIIFLYLSIYCLLFFRVSFLTISPLIYFSFLLLLLFSFPSWPCLHPHKELGLILSCILICLKFGCYNIVPSKLTSIQINLAASQWNRTRFFEDSS